MASIGSLAMPMVRAKTLVDPPGRTPSAVGEPASPLAASLRVPSPPRTTAASRPSAAAPWASRAAWPRRLVSFRTTSWSADSALWITTRARAVTNEADVFTIKGGPGIVRSHFSRRWRSRQAERSWARLRASRRETCICEILQPAGDLRLCEAVEKTQLQDKAFARGQLRQQRGKGGSCVLHPRAMGLPRRGASPGSHLPRWPRRGRRNGKPGRLRALPAPLPPRPSLPSPARRWWESGLVPGPSAATTLPSRR